MKYKHSLCWIRRDLRLHDHVALAEATRQSEFVTVIFIFDTRILEKLYDKDDKRITFIHQSLLELDQALRDQNSQLLVRHGDAQEEIPKLAKQLKADAVFTNRDYQPAAKKRDQEVQKRLSGLSVDFNHYKDHVIFEGLEVRKGSGDAYRIFTPYENTWLSQLTPEDYREYKPQLNRLTPIKNLKTHLKSWDLKTIGFTHADLWLAPGVKAAHKRLKEFESHIDSYGKQRNYPALKNGTSGLSVHLRFGTVSIRELVRFGKEFRSEGSRTWLSELIWRDFYQMILDQFPYVGKGSFKKECDQIKWPGKEENFEAWKKGMTGFPLVDAAMRHFNETGWMHNRLRMVVASFLTKDLLVHWRKGERWFARKLLDYDMAANNGGWQWSASTGCDAQPYFRIFNPISQSEKFDPRGEFIRENVPELKQVSDKKIHWPHEENLWDSKPDYPGPIVDHSVQRIKAMALFKRKHRLYILLILVVSLFHNPGFAGDWGLELETGPAWFSKNEVRIPGNNGTKFDMLDLTGSGPNVYFRLYGTYQFNPKHALRLTLAPLEAEGTGQLPQDVQFQNQTFLANTDTKGTYRFNTYRMTYRWSFYRSPKWHWGLGPTLLVRDAKIQLEQANTKARKNNVGLVPLLHLYGAYKFNDHISAVLDVDGSGASQGRAIDAAIKGEYNFSSGWFGSLGYRTLEGGADNENVYSFAWIHYLLLSAGYKF